MPPADSLLPNHTFRCVRIGAGNVGCQSLRSQAGSLGQAGSLVIGPDCRAEKLYAPDAHIVGRAMHDVTEERKPVCND